MNEKTKVVGKQVLNFVNEETGEKIEGINLFCLVTDDHVDGFKAAKQFIPATSPAYASAAALDFSKGSLTCVFNYAYKVGQKKPSLLSVEVVSG